MLEDERAARARQAEEFSRQIEALKGASLDFNC